MAILITCTVMLNSFKADAVAVPASLLAYLIQACAQVLVGSGAVAQNDFNKMSTSDVFDMTKQVAPSVNLPLPDLGYYLMKFIAQHPEATLPYSVWDILRDACFSDFIFDNADSLDTVVPELQGFGALGVVTVYNSSTGVIDNRSLVFGSYGIIYPGAYSNVYGDKILRQYTDVYHNAPTTEKEYSGSFTLGGAFGNANVKVKYVGDWRLPDGSIASDYISFSEEIPAPIGTVDVDGETYDLNGDGTVNIDDKTYTINDDGSITIDGKTYYPDYDFSNYNTTTLIQLLLSLLDNIDVTEETEDDTVDDSDVEVSGAIANSELSSLTMPKTIATVFPFCIPWDFYHGIKILSEKPVAPRFEVPFEIPAYKSFPGFKKMIVIDFEEYSTAFAVVRWTMFTIFMFGLCFITFKIVKGA